MPTARSVAVAVVENKIIYVIGGWNGIFSGPGLATVESYDPATETWTEESQLLVGKWAPSGGLFGTKASGYTIVVPDGAAQCCPSGFTGDNEAYNASTNAWTWLTSDPTARANHSYCQRTSNHRPAPFRETCRGWGTVYRIAIHVHSRE